MEIKSDDLNAWKEKLLDILKYYIDFCNQNKLLYYCCGGTAIGAIRHHGFIPWDDDIDVIMPRKDYERFIECWNNSHDTSYSLLNYKDCKTYQYTHSKICLRKTTLIQNKMQSYDGGLFVDIFVLDGCADNEKEFIKDYKRYKLQTYILEALSTPLSIFTRLNYAINGHKSFLRSIPFYILKPFIDRSCVIKKIDEICRKYDFESSAYVVCYAGSYKLKERIDKKWLGKGNLVSFEGLLVRVPVDYDSYLSHFYGNYMKLPPQDKRYSHHIVEYYNLDEFVPLKDVLTNRNK